MNREVSLPIQPLTALAAPLAAVLAAASVSAAAAPEAPPAPERVIAAVVEAYGGDALAVCDGFRTRGRVLSLVDGSSGKLREAVSLDGSFRAEIRYPGREEIRVLAGRLAWNGGRRRQVLSGTEMADSMRLQFHRLAAPFELASMDPAELESLAPSEEGWHRVQRHWNDRTRTIYEVDPESGRIRRIRGEVGQGDDVLEFVSETNDFREIDGVLFPFRVTTVVAGEPAAETILDRVLLESDFGAEEFRPDGSGTGGDI